MLSLKYIRENLEEVKSSLSKKMPEFDISELLELDSDRINLLKEVEKLRAKKNSNSDQISELKKMGKNVKNEIESMKFVATEIKTIEKSLKRVED